MSAWAGWWIMWGLIILGCCVDNGLSNVAKGLKAGSGGNTE